ncbi:MAG: Cna B-type domain-containing protein, partial [Clostridia bacterium]|nr:Cna B-type domain-containing protein [Clostridia bacterium]
MKTNNFFKRFFAIFLVAIMVFSSTHLTFAADGNSNSYEGPAEHDKSKTATDLYDNRYTDVTLSVPGKVETLSTDVVFVIDKSSSDKLSSDFANGFFEQLVEVQKRSGALVKVGVVIFNYDGHIALPLTALTEENYQTLLDSLPSYSGGTNADAGLVLAKQMLDADTDVDASRKHVILIGDGKNWAFDVNGAPHTILLKSNDAATSTLYGAGTTTWLEGRKSSGYSIPKEFASWNEYWEQIKAWVEADGDRYVFDITNYNSKDESLKPDYQSEKAVASAVVIGESASHALNMDRAIYDTWESYKALQDAGYNCNAYYSGTSSSDIGYCLMSMLADSKSMSFDDIKYDILYSVSKGSVIEDYIGFSADEIEGYNFDFIEQAEKLVLKVGEIIYSTEKLEEAKNGATSSYEFTAPGATEATFALDYFKGNGTTTERFVWTFGENVSRFAPVSLTYTLDLVERSTVPGIHENVDTNISAILYPKDSDGKDGPPEEFEKPKVKYEVLPITVSGVKTWNDEDDRDGIRPESITINLLADGEKIDSKVVTEADGWAWTFEGLREYKGSSKIEYTVTEDAVEGYEAAVDGLNVTNTYVPEKTTVSGTKTWVDDDNADGMRPESITINLLANGEKIDSKVVTEADGWAWTF